MNVSHNKREERSQQMKSIIKKLKESVFTSIRLGCSFYFFSFVQKITVQRLINLLSIQGQERKSQNNIFAYFFLLLTHTSYIYTSLEMLLFRPILLDSFFPQINKMFKKVGMKDFIDNDQTNNCSKAHPNVSCLQNTTYLWGKWWKAIGPLYIGTKLFYHTVLKRNSIFTFRLLLSIRQLLFLFSSSGIIGSLFCFYKNYINNNYKMNKKPGDRKGVLICSFVGALCALSTLPLIGSLRMINSMYVGSLTAVLLRVTRGQY